MVAEMISRGPTPAAWVMSPPQLLRLRRSVNSDNALWFDLDPKERGSGYSLLGLPVYRSWCISGVTLLDDHALKVLIASDAFTCRAPVLRAKQIEEICLF